MKKSITSAVLALLFVVAGVIIIGNLLNAWDLPVFFDGWWTLFIIIPTSLEILKRGFRFGNTFGLSIGIILLLKMQGVIESGELWQFILAIFLILFGISIFTSWLIKFKLFNFLKGHGKNGIFSEDGKTINVKFNNPSFENFDTVIFNDGSRDFSGKEFKGGCYKAIFGGGKIDLRGAIIKEDCVLVCEVLFGGFEIFVPQDVNITVSGSNVFGGTDNKCSGRPYNSELPTIKIYTKSIFGGVVIK